MLLNLLFHKIDKKKLFFLEKLFLHISKNYPIVVPGDKLEKKRVNICLSFDDGSFDFYHRVYPLLQKYDLKALLAISPSFLFERSDLDKKKRLELPLALKPSDYYCTWEEIDQMHRSSFVKIASHGYSHQNLIFANIDHDIEIKGSKDLLEQKLSQRIDTFVYPYGKFNRRVHKMVKRHYPYIMRIGSSINFSWNNLHNLNYRIVADHVESIDQLFSKKQFVSYLFYPRRPQDLFL